MKQILFVLLILNCIVAKAQHDRPNIILFMVDEMGWQDTSVEFWKEKTVKNTIFKTPAMDKLSAQGTRFTQAYVTPNEMSTQISLYTSLHTAGQHNIDMKKVETMPQLLSKAGYRTILCGWTISDLVVESHFDASDTNPDKSLSQLTSEAITEMDITLLGKKPFFLMFNAKTKGCTTFIQKYKDAGLTDADAEYASSIESTDAGLCEVMNYLQTNSIADNTVVIFISSIGGQSVNTERSGVVNTQNYPLRAGKGSVYEGGIRVPMIVKLPKNPMVQKECVVPVQITDFMPTILEIAGVKRSEVRQKMDGRSFIPVINSGGNRTRGFTRSLYWHSPLHYETNPEMGYGATSSIISGDWKLVHYYASGDTELFNLRDDIFEIANQAVNQSVDHILRRLANDLTRHLKSKKAAVPAKKRYPNGK